MGKHVRESRYPGYYELSQADHGPLCGRQGSEMCPRCTPGMYAHDGARHRLGRAL